MARRMVIQADSRRVRPHECCRFEMRGRFPVPERALRAIELASTRGGRVKGQTAPDLHRPFRKRRL